MTLSDLLLLSVGYVMAGTAIAWAIIARCASAARRSSSADCDGETLDHEVANK